MTTENWARRFWECVHEPAYFVKTHVSLCGRCHAAVSQSLLVYVSSRDGVPVEEAFDRLVRFEAWRERRSEVA